jgi:hypothetical protein
LAAKYIGQGMLVQDRVGPTAHPRESFGFEERPGFDTTLESTVSLPIALELFGPGSGQGMVRQAGALLAKGSPMAMERGRFRGQTLRGHWKAAMLAPFDGHHRRNRESRGGQQASVEIGGQGGWRGGGVSQGNPDDLVIGWIVVLGKIDVVLPEQMIGDRGPIGRQDRHHITQGERFVGVSEKGPARGAG